MTTSKPWWQTDAYDNEIYVPPVFTDLSGPQGIALVRHYESGMTDPGWGLKPGSGGEGFMPRYLRGEFNARRVLYGYERRKFPGFAFVMRSLQLVTVDIDGKNGGLDHAKRLGKLPVTTAETSKSGNGYHLFYLLEEEWDPATGFGLVNDRIGIEQGVDIRATGCVYHYPSQKWNRRKPAKLPAHLLETLQKREQMQHSTTDRIDSILANNDDLEVLMLHDEILSKLAKPIPDGKRNVTLFALGNQMRQAGIPDWEGKLEARADQVGLDDLETKKLVANIAQYGSPVEP